MSIWYQTSGEGMPLLLVHGWGMNATVWEPVLKKLNHHFEVTRLDLPGHGLSDEADQNTLTAWADDIAQIAPDNAIWLGWSLGGLVALQAALNKTKKIRALYLMNSTPCFSQRGKWQCAMPSATLTQFAENLEQDTEATLVRFLSLQIKGSDDARELLKKLRAGFAAHPKATETALKAGLGYLSGTDVRLKLTDINVPMHWTFGGLDTLVPSCASELIKQVLPGESVQVINRAGHVPFLSHPDECLQSLHALARRSAV